MTPVTDRAVLELLAAPQPVTDPELLRQLNGDVPGRPVAEPLTDFPLPPGVQVVAPPPPQGAPEGWQTVVTPAKQAELRAYKPTWRDRIAQLLMGDERASPERARAVEMLMGSRGLGHSSPGAIDFTPLTMPLVKNEMDAAQTPTEAAWSALGVIPAARGGSAATREMLKAAMERRAAAAAELPKPGPATLSLKQAPDDVDKLPLQRVYDMETRTYKFEPTTRKEAIARAPADERASHSQLRTWMVDARGEVENLNAIPPGELHKWKPIYSTNADAGNYLSPAEMAASRAMWGNPEGSLWDKAWMPTEAPQGVKDAVREMKTTGKTWGDVLADLVAKMKASGAPQDEITRQMPVIMTQVARNLAGVPARAMPQLELPLSEPTQGPRQRLMESMMGGVP